MFCISLPYSSAQTTSNSSRPVPVDDIYKDQKESQVETVADTLEYVRNEKKLIAKGNVVITYGDERITADYAEVFSDSKLALAKGHVIIFNNHGPVAKGDEVTYDFEKRMGTFPNGTILSTPWTCTGNQINKIDDGKVQVKDATFTTCQGDNPPYEVRAKEVIIKSDDKLLAKNVVIYSLGKPIFWWPYLIVPLQYRSLPFSVSGGYGDDFGWYVETKKGFSVNKYLWGVWHADYRAKRGFGGGVDLSYDYEPLGAGEIKTYWTQDNDSPDAGAIDPFGERVDKDRGRLTWWHRKDLDEYSHIQFRYHRVADEYFLQEFFEKENRGDVGIQSFATLTKNTEKFGILFHASKRTNDFEKLVERLPEVRVDWKNQPVAWLPSLYYKNQTSYASLAKRFGRASHNEDVQRADHVSEFILPLKVDEFSITPYTQGRGTFYSRERLNDDANFRVVGAAGVDVRTQYYKTYDVQSEKFGVEIDQLRHLVEPVANYDAIRSTLSDERLSTFDSIDTIDDQDLISVGIENRLQTKRVVDGRVQRVDLVSFNTYMRYAMHNGDTNGVSTLTIFDQELVLRPYDWLQYQARFEYDFYRDQARLFNQDIIMRKNKFMILFGQRYVADLDNVNTNFGNNLLTNFGQGSNQFVIETQYKLNDLWAFGGYTRWDVSSGDFEEWQVSAERDMQCLLLDFGYNVRNSGIQDNNKEVFFNLRLKDYQSFAIRGGGNRASFSEPRIGETVLGSRTYNNKNSILNSQGN